ncbi:hypothetical protein ACWDSJ_26175 [Nocardia sp. NPDC003482]
MTQSGDPVEEAGQAVRTGFVQSMQTAAMTANLLQRRGAESRSVTEHHGRLADRVVEQGRKGEIHQLQAWGYHHREGRDRALFDLQLRIKQAQLDAMTADAERKVESDKAFDERQAAVHRERIAGMRADRNRRDALHAEQMRGYARRAAQDRHLHKLKVEYQELLIESRRRAMGFTETLDAHTAYAGAATAGAQWAAAHATADLSEEHNQHTDAYAERYAEDTGADPHQIVDSAWTYHPGPADTAVDIDPDTIIDAEVVEIDPTTGQFVTDPALDAESESSSGTEAAMAGLADELVFETYASAADPTGSDGPPAAAAGEIIGEAVDAVAAEDVAAVPEWEAQPTLMLPAVPDAGSRPGPEVAS